MSKKMLYAALSSVFAIGVLAACGGETDPGEDPADQPMEPEEEPEGDM